MHASDRSRHLPRRISAHASSRTSRGRAGPCSALLAVALSACSPRRISPPRPPRTPCRRPSPTPAPDLVDGLPPRVNPTARPTSRASPLPASRRAGDTVLPHLTFPTTTPSPPACSRTAMASFTTRCTTPSSAPSASPTARRWAPATGGAASRSGWARRRPACPRPRCSGPARKPKWPACGPRAGTCTRSRSRPPSVRPRWPIGCWKARPRARAWPRSTSTPSTPRRIRTGRIPKRPAKRWRTSTPPSASCSTGCTRRRLAHTTSSWSPTTAWRRCRRGSRFPSATW